MEYRNLGHSGIKVSVLCLGAMMFGGRTNEADSKEIIARAREQGVNFLDTADAYNKGESERVVGRALQAERDRWILATKVYNPMGEGLTTSTFIIFTRKTSIHQWKRPWLRSAILFVPARSSISA
jgi:aryl-alcohol dehydrogenase-like predicted oxidoreductase